MFFLHDFLYPQRLPSVTILCILLEELFSSDIRVPSDGRHVSLYSISLVIGTGAEIILQVRPEEYTDDFNGISLPPLLPYFTVGVRTPGLSYTTRDK